MEHGRNFFRKKRNARDITLRRRRRTMDGRLVRRTVENVRTTNYYRRNRTAADGIDYRRRYGADYWTRTNDDGRCRGSTETKIVGRVILIRTGTRTLTRGITRPITPGQRDDL